jgi:SurA N-terminal domain
MSKRILPVLALAFTLLPGCSKGSKDTAKVLANVGGEKITQTDLEVLVKAMVPDPQQAQKLMTSEGFRTQKAEFVQQLAMQKVLLAYARKQGVDQDPAVKVRAEGAMAQVYFQTLLAKRAGGSPPTDAQLQGMYDEVKRKRPDLPPFDAVKAQLAQEFGQYQLMKEVRLSTPVTYADEVGDPGL